MLTFPSGLALRLLPLGASTRVQDVTVVLVATVLPVVAVASLLAAAVTTLHARTTAASVTMIAVTAIAPVAPRIVTATGT